MESVSAREAWCGSAPTPLLVGQRITRRDRTPLGEVALDGSTLFEFGRENLGLVVDSCTAAVAMAHLQHAAMNIRFGLAWVFAEDYERVPPKAPCQSFTHQLHPTWRDWRNWESDGVHAVYVGANAFRLAPASDPMKRVSNDPPLCPFVAVVDEDFDLLRLPGKSRFDRCRVIKDFKARLTARQGGVPLVIFAKSPSRLLPVERWLTVFGVAGFYFVDGTSIGRNGNVRAIASADGDAGAMG